MLNLKLYYFGPFRAEVNGEVVTNFRTEKTAALLAYLAFAGKVPQPRTQLTNLLWHGYEANAAQTSLRVALTHLRQMLAPLQPIKATRKQLHWNEDGITIWSDVQALTAITQTTPKRISAQQLADGLALYRGAFLDGWETVDSAPFQAWLQQRRTYYQSQVASLRRRLAKMTDKVSLPRRHNLPRRLTPLFTDQADRERLRSLLLAPQHPLITLVGEGGVGKTRLALAAAWSLVEAAEGNTTEAPSFADGLWFVPLSDLTPTTTLADELASAIGVACAFTFTATAPLTEQLIAWLRNKKLLLILDTFEHLTADCTWLETLVEEAPHVKILVTSRQRLCLQAATVFPVHELATPRPGQDVTVEELLTYPSVQLFAERSRRVRPSFRVDETNGEAVAQICRQMAGLPLGIELAASMVLLYSPEQVVEQLAQDTLIPQVEWVDIPKRHQSIEAVLTTSWRLLNADEALTMARLAVLKGEFTQEAATIIGEAEPKTLLALMDKFLLRQKVDRERFVMHDLIRAYALRQLQQQPTIETAARHQHAVYFLTMIEQEASTLPNRAAGRERLVSELANIRAAWNWSVAQGKVALWSKAIDGLTWFYRLVGFHQEAILAFQAAAAAIHPQAATSNGADNHQPVLARLLAYIAEFCRYSGQQTKSKQLLAEALHWSEQSGDPASRVLIYYEMARLAQFHGDFTTMLTHAQQAREWAQQSEQPQLMLFSLYSLHIAHYYRNDFTALFAITDELEQKLQLTPNRYLQNILLGNLGYAYGRQYNYMQALQALHQAVMGNWLLNQQRSIKHACIHLGELFYELGVFDTAEALYSQSLAYFQQNKNFYWVVLAQKGLGCVAYATGNFVAALQHFNAAHQLTKQHAMAYLEHLVLIDLGYTLATMGDEKAIACYQQAISLGEQGEWHNSLGAAYAALANLALGQGDRITARHAVENALSFLTYARTGISEPFRGRWHCYEVLHALGDPRAEAFLQQSYADLIAIANRLTDLMLRRSFLEKVPVNRALVAAAQAGVSSPSSAYQLTKAY